MWSVPEGYGHISSTKLLAAWSVLGSGSRTRKACSSSQTRCHFASVVWVSYLSKGHRDRPLLPTDMCSRGRGLSPCQFLFSFFLQKSLSGERPWEAAAAAPRVLPALDKQLLHQDFDTSNLCFGFSPIPPASTVASSTSAAWPRASSRPRTERRSLSTARRRSAATRARTPSPLRMR